MVIRSKAPLRISFGGGGTDVSPYPEERGGCVLSTTIGKYTYGTLIPHGDQSISVNSCDYNIVANYDIGYSFEYNGELDLVKAVTKVMNVRKGFDLVLHSDVPPGAGLGSSSCLVVVLVGLFKHWMRLPLTTYEIAELAYYIERQEYGMKGGKQDQYSATFGGVNFIEFLGETTIVNPLRISDEMLDELHYRLVLCYTGKTRLSAGIIDDQTKGYIKRRPKVVKALDETKTIAIDMKNALLRGRLNEFGSLFHEAWVAKKKFSTEISNPQIDELYEFARKNGAVGGKLLGAGGGGYLLLFCQFSKKHILARRLEELGVKVMEFAFDFKGLRTWDVSDEWQ